MLARWIAVAFVVVFLAILWAADQGQLPSFLRRFYSFPHGDKVGHFFLMGLLNLSAIMLLPRGRMGCRKRVVVISIGVAVLVGIEEVSQRYLAQRTFSLADLLASYAGIACAALFAARRAKSRKTQEI